MHGDQKPETLFLRLTFKKMFFSKTLTPIHVCIVMTLSHVGFMIYYSQKLKELLCGHSQVQLLEDMHNCTSLKSVMFKKQLTLLVMSLTLPWHLFKR